MLLAAWEHTKRRAGASAGSNRRELNGGRGRLRSHAPQRNSWYGISVWGLLHPSCLSFDTRLL